MLLHRKIAFLLLKQHEIAIEAVVFIDLVIYIHREFVRLLVNST